MKIEHTINGFIFDKDQSGRYTVHAHEHGGSVIAYIDSQDFGKHDRECYVKIASVFGITGTARDPTNAEMNGHLFEDSHDERVEHVDGKVNEKDDVKELDYIRKFMSDNQAKYTFTNGSILGFGCIVDCRFNDNVTKLTIAQGLILFEYLHSDELGGKYSLKDMLKLLDLIPSLGMKESDSARLSALCYQYIDMRIRNDFLLTVIDFSELNVKPETEKLMCKLISRYICNLTNPMDQLSILHKYGGIELVHMATRSCTGLPLEIPESTYHKALSTIISVYGMGVPVGTLARLIDNFWVIDC